MRPFSDCVDHESLYVVLKEMGVPRHLIVLLCNLCDGQEATVRAEYGETEWLPIGKGIRQGCILSPYLFNLYAEHIRKTGPDAEEGGVKTGGTNINIKLCR